MKIRLIISTSSPKKRVPLSLKLAIPPIKHKGFNEFVKAAITGKSEVTFTFDKIQGSAKSESSVHGTFKFHPVNEAKPERINKSPIKKVLDYEQDTKYKLVLKSKSPRKKVPIILKLKIPKTKNKGFINIINAALKNDSMVSLYFELITKEKQEKSKVAGDFYLFLK